MTAELLAQNVVAHWMQAAGVAGAAWLGVSVLRLREPGFLLKYWQAVLLVLLLAPWVQPWQPAAATPAPGLPLLEPEREPAGVAGASAAESVVALPAERWSVDPWRWVLGLLAAVAVFRLARLGLGLVRLGRLARSADRVAPPAPAREILARFPTPATFIQPPDVRMPCSFGLFRPTVVLPAAFGRLEPVFQRGIVCPTGSRRTRALAPYGYTASGCRLRGAAARRPARIHPRRAPRPRPSASAPTPRCSAPTLCSRPPLPYPDPERIVRVGESTSARREMLTNRSMPLVRDAEAFEHPAGYREDLAAVGGAGRLGHLRGAFVSRRRCPPAPQRPAAVRVTRVRSGLPVTSSNIDATSSSAKPASRIRPSMVSAG